MAVKRQAPTTPAPIPQTIVDKGADILDAIYTLGTDSTIHSGVRLDALKYLSDKIHGKAQQQVAVSGGAGDALSALASAITGRLPAHVDDDDEDVVDVEPPEDDEEEV